MIIAVLISLIVVGLAFTAQAYTFYINEFAVAKNGSVFFHDKFNDGNPPPSVPSGTTLSYLVAGTMGPELNRAPNPGKLTLDSSGGVVALGPTGKSFLEQRALVMTNVDPANTTLGLKSGSTFAVGAIFDLVVPSMPSSHYGVRLTDGTASNTADDVAFVRVGRTSTDIVIQFVHLDFVAHTSTVLGQVPLDPNDHTTISVMLSKADPSTSTVTASYAYDDGDFVQIPGSMDIFHGENFTRAQFLVAEPVVPETVIVSFDIKPGGYPNSINLGSKGVVPVAVFSRAYYFDASTIDPGIVMFAGAHPAKWEMQDLNGDGLADMLFHFRTEDLFELSNGSTEATLKGKTVEGVDFEGTDTVKIVPQR